jgi:DNA end-binding protein Ku
VDLDEIDPVYFRSTYYLAPEGEAGAKAYALLRQAMRDANKVAIGTLVMRNKEYPVAIRPDDEVLKLETMYFADEIRSPTKELPDLPDASELSDREISMAKLLVESMESEWEPDRYRDTHREKVHALVEAKRDGNEIVIGAAEPAATKVVDLMDVLAASIESVKSGGKAPKGAAAADTSTAVKRPAAKRAAPARKAPAAKTPTSITSKRTPKSGAAAQKGTAKAPAKTASRRKAS